VDAYEAKLLRVWIRELQNPPGLTLKARLFAAATYLSLFLVFLVFFVLERALTGWAVLTLIFWAAVTGAALALVLLQKRGVERLAFLAPHVSVESMKARLAELEG
jgi:hypothetical protein